MWVVCANSVAYAPSVELTVGRLRDQVVQSGRIQGLDFFGMGLYHPLGHGYLYVGKCSSFQGTVPRIRAHARSTLVWSTGLFDICLHPCAASTYMSATAA